MSSGTLSLTVANRGPDEDGVFRLGIRASNGEFSAHSETWAVSDGVSELVAQLNGFPRRIPDEVIFKTGEPSDVTLKFSTLGKTGHCGIQVMVRAAPVAEAYRAEIAGSANFWIQCSAEEVSSFRTQLARLFETRTATFGE